MMEMIERVARALALCAIHEEAKHQNELGGWARATIRDRLPEYIDGAWNGHMAGAGAAIEAIREPTKAMIRRGGDELDRCADAAQWSDGEGNLNTGRLNAGAQTEIFRAMIDEARGK